MIRPLLLIALSLLAISSGVPQWRERPVTTEAPEESLKEHMCKVHGDCEATESPVRTEDKLLKRCHCVTAHKCRGSFNFNEDVSSYYRSIGGQLMNPKCDHYLERCCKIEDIITKYLNEDGIDFH